MRPVCQNTRQQNAASQRTGKLRQYMAAGDVADLDGVRTIPATPWTLPAEAQRLGTWLTSIQGLALPSLPS